jgi:nucleotide-binding universal stress UspA family protein
MALHDILVCIDGTAAGDIRFQLALNLAQTSKAHLTTVYALREPRGSAVPPAGVGLPPTVLGPVSPEGARAIEGQPISAAAPVVQVLREAERADAFEEHFREELNLWGLTGEWHIVDHTDLAELIELAETADLAVLGQYPGEDSDGVTWLRPDHVVTDTKAGRWLMVTCPSPSLDPDSCDNALGRGYSAAGGRQPIAAGCLLSTVSGRNSLPLRAKSQTMALAKPAECRPYFSKTR